MGGIPLTKLKEQMTPKTLPLRKELVVPPELRGKPDAAKEAKPAGETYGSTTKKTISLEELKKMVEGLKIKPELLKETLTA